MKRRRVSEVIAQLNPWLIAGFLVMIVTGGSALLWRSCVVLLHYLFFKIKMILLLLAGLNVLLFNSTIGRKVDQWDLDSRTPGRAKIAAIISLVFWVAIIAAGRAIAYALPPP